MNSNKKIFVNGCFDVLTPAHANLLSYAASLGNLYVAIDTDERVKELKGSTRPFFNQYERRLMLEKIKGVDRVYFFNSDEELEKLVFMIKPDVQIVGSDYKDKTVIGSQFAKEVQFFPRDERYSTTKILNYYSDLALESIPRHKPGCNAMIGCAGSACTCDYLNQNTTTIKLNVWSAPGWAKIAEETQKDKPKQFGDPGWDELKQKQLIEFDRKQCELNPELVKSQYSSLENWQSQETKDEMIKVRQQRQLLHNGYIPKSK